MVLDAVSEYGTGAGDPGSGQTLQARFNDGFSTFGGVSTASGATSVTMSWSLNGRGQYYTHAAIDIPAVPSPTTTALIAPSSITYGTNASITVTVSCGAGTPTGNVSLTVDGGTPLTQTLSGGTTVFTIPGLPAGDHSLSATYAGEAIYWTSSATDKLTVNSAALTITAKNESKTYGTTFTPNGATQFTASGLVNGDTISSVLLASSGYAATASVAGSPYAIVASAAGGSGLGNYTITYVNGTLTVNPAPLSATAVNFRTTAGAPFSGPLATFTNVAPNTSPYTALINWGDGSTSSVTISVSGSSLTVRGAHTYAAAKTYTVTVQISNPNTTTAQVTDTAPVTSLNQSVGKGLAAGIGFWHNTNGQALLSSFNGSASATALSAWLAATFPNLYGAYAGSNNLSGQSNAQVAAYFLTLFNLDGTQVQAQVLATALNVYATTTSLGGNAAAAYGFSVSATGLGACSYSVGSDGAAFGVANNTTCNVYQLLLAVNQQAVHGVLYNGNATLQSQAAALLNALNEAGGI
jgi:hypothetical protein